MKKVIGIYTYYHGMNEPYWDENSDNMGGSETWTIRIAEEFQKKGFHVIVFGNPQVWHFSVGGVEYVPKQLLSLRCQYQHFDYFISSRTAVELNKDISCDNFYIMSHEAIINGAKTYYDLKPNLFKKIACLSEWHKDCLLSQYGGLTSDRLFLTFNGVDTELYADSDNDNKKNLMVWSSCKERGLRYFVNAIFPCIKRMVPDFELAICAYNNDIDETFSFYPGIKVYGKLSKKELAELQKQAKIWIYPNYGIDEETGFCCHETFCISAIENGFAKNAIICSNATGLDTTLNGYSGFIGTDLDLSFDKTNRETRNELKNRIIEQAINVLYDDNYRIKLANESYEICKKYTWENAANNLLKNMNAI